MELYEQALSAKLDGYKSQIPPPPAEETIRLWKGEIKSYIDLQRHFQHILMHICRSENPPLREEIKKELKVLDHCLHFGTKMMSANEPVPADIEAFQNEGNEIAAEVARLEPDLARKHMWNGVLLGIGIGVLVASMVVGTALIMTGVGAGAGMGVMLGGLITFLVLQQIGTTKSFEAYDLARPAKESEEMHEKLFKIFTKKSKPDEEQAPKPNQDAAHDKPSSTTPKQ